MRYITYPQTMICELYVVLWKRVLHQMGEPFEKHVEMQDENYGQDDCFSLNSSKAQQELKWSCQVPFEGGRAGHKEWVNDNWEQISKMNLEYVHQP